MSAKLELPPVFTAVPPESEEYIAACLAYDAEYARLQAQEVETGVRTPLSAYFPAENAKDDAFVRCRAGIRAIEEALPADYRRDLASRMIGKILQHGTVTPPRPHQATVQYARYFGQTTIHDKPYFWGARLESWHHQPEGEDAERVLSYDEHAAREEVMLERFPHASPGHLVATLATELSGQGYPALKRQTSHTDLHALVRVYTNGAGICVNYGVLHAGYPMIPVSLTAERMTQIDEFVDALEPQTDDEMAVSGNHS